MLKGDYKQGSLILRQLFSDKVLLNILLQKIIENNGYICYGYNFLISTQNLIAVEVQDVFTLANPPKVPP